MRKQIAHEEIVDPARAEVTVFYDDSTDSHYYVVLIEDGHGDRYEYTAYRYVWTRRSGDYFVTGFGFDDRA